MIDYTKLFKLIALLVKTTIIAFFIFFLYMIAHAISYIVIIQVITENNNQNINDKLGGFPFGYYCYVLSVEGKIG